MIRHRNVRYITFIVLTFFAISLIGYIKPNIESSGVAADKVVINKSKRELILFLDNKEIKRYKVALGSNPIGAKFESGDGKTPEGEYSISFKNEHSKYHLSLKISYPSMKDKELALKSNVDSGGDIMIHGLPNWLWFVGSTHVLYDWTAGCIAVTNNEIEEIWKLVPIGTSVFINP